MLAPVGVGGARGCATIFDYVSEMRAAIGYTERSMSLFFA